MKVLYITAANLTKNTSANMSHNGYIQGFIENGAEIEIIMANDSWGEQDNKLKKWDGVKYYEYNSVSFADTLRIVLRSIGKQTDLKKSSIKSSQDFEIQKMISHKKNSFYALGKKLFHYVFRPDSVYPLNRTWLNNARKFKSEKIYDIIVSNSSPSASHRLVADLICHKRVKGKRWIQIWEDPWYHDLYGGHSDAILKEEHALLQAGQEIYYVSPLTLYYQKLYYSDCAVKMDFVPLPFLKFGDNEDFYNGVVTFGYFGDYFSYTRNLKPFYDALVECGAMGNIFGDSDLHFESSNNVRVCGRVTLDVLERVQNETTVLVHLCNLRGGQIPGKIYHYSGTTKPILFILDGTSEEKSIIKNFFSQYNRYYFCENRKEEIIAAIQDLSGNIDRYKGNVVTDFSPKEIVAQLINKP